MPLEFPGGYGYQSPSLPPPYAYPTPFPMELGAFGPLAYMGLQASGLMPPGLANMSFSPTTDLYTQFQSIQQFQLRAQSMQRSQSADIQSLMRYQQSFATASGADWSKLQGRAQTASNWIGSMLPTLAMIMPEAIDTAMGPRGSQVVMASQMASASRFMFDPASGRAGMTAAETGQFTDSLYKNLYGTDAAMSQMRGMGAGRAGILMNEMLARGLVGNQFKPPGTGDEFSQIAGLLGGSGGPGGVMGGLGTMNAGRLSSTNMDKTADQLRGMVKIVTSISDMLGANGQPNAPIPQLLAALDQLGQGVEYKYSAPQVENLFRSMQQATLTGKISLPQMSQMVSQNAALLQSVGGDPREAIAMTQRSVNYAAGAANIFTSPFYGKMDPRTLASASAGLEAAGVNSPSGQMAQVALFLADSSSGLNGNSEFSQLAGAIRSGATTYAGGKSVLNALQGGNLRELYTSAGGAVANFNAAAMNPEVARRYGNVTAGVTRRLQYDEMSNMSSAFIGGDLAGIFGINDSGQRIEAGKGLINSLFSNAGKFTGMSPQAQAAEIERMAAEAASSVTGAPIAAMRQRAAGSAPQLLAALNGAMVNFTGNDLTGAMQLFNPEMFKQGTQLNASNQIGANIGSALGDMGRFSFSQRLLDGLQNLDAKADLTTVLAKAMGGLNKGEIEKALNTGMAGGGSLRSGIMKSLAEIRAGGSPDAVKALQEQLVGFKAAMEGQGVSFDKIARNMVIGEGAATGATLSSLMGNPVGMGIGLASTMNSDWGRTMAGSKGMNNRMDITLKGEMEITGDGKAKLSGTGSSEGPTTGKDKK